MKTPIQSGMTREPVSIASDVSIGDAQEIMRSWGMRHLPVVEREKLIGLISDRDILRAFALQKSSATEVREVMTTTPYQVRQDTSVAETARVMALNKYGCAVVTDAGERVVGIFTTTDALNLLARVLNQPSEADYRIVQLREYLARQRTA